MVIFAVALLHVIAKGLLYRGWRGCFGVLVRNNVGVGRVSIVGIGLWTNKHSRFLKIRISHLDNQLHKCKLQFSS